LAIFPVPDGIDFAVYIFFGGYYGKCLAPDSPSHESDKRNPGGLGPVIERKEDLDDEKG
jgi:hypothetical protein